jgi:NAD(P)-dependent dehydrogenase (short-subunit alcohol dehydrogenase family)
VIAPSATGELARQGRLAGRTVLVTGAAGGLGRHFCLHLVAQGANVVVADIAADEATVLAGLLNDAVGAECALPVAVDVRSPQSAAAMVQAGLDAFGAIDVLLNNVGSYPHVDFDDIDLEAWRRVMQLNLDSAFVCTSAVLEPMKARGRGKIVNLATNLVWIGLPSMVHYVAAKSGIVGFTRALAREVGPHGITVNALAPGAVAPPPALLDDAARARLDAIVARQCVRRPQAPEDLIGPLLFLVSADSDFVSGQVLTVDGGLTNH